MWLRHRNHDGDRRRRRPAVQDPARRLSAPASGGWRGRCCYGVLVNSAVVVEEFPVPAEQLHTETRGAGPLLLFVVGGNGDPAVFSGVADHLADRFTVVTYARRGFVQSPADGTMNAASRIATDAEDAAALIARHGDGPARVFGSSSGAIVALDLVTRHPELVCTFVVL